MILQIQHFTKQCTKCKTLKQFDMFSRDKNKKHGISTVCKVCIKEYQKIYLEINRYKIIDKRKEYYEKNREVILLKKDVYYKENKVSIIDKNRKYRHENKTVIKDRYIKYYQRNKEFLTRQKRLKYQNNTDNYRQKVKIANSKYSKNNRESLIKYSREYYLNNKHKFIEYAKTEKGRASVINSKHKRRSQKKLGDVTTSQILELKRSTKTCYWCNTALKNKKVHIDHYVPLSKGGDHTLNNLVVTCPDCNLKKNAKDPFVFAQSIGKLF